MPQIAHVDIQSLAKLLQILVEKEDAVLEPRAIHAAREEREARRALLRYVVNDLHGTTWRNIRKGFESFFFFFLFSYSFFLLNLRPILRP
jgi:hypothetical protein